jgi:hypothetical protein
MTPDEIERDAEAEVKRTEKTVMDEVQKDEDELNRLLDHVVEEQKTYKDTTGWPPV